MTENGKDELDRHTVRVPFADNYQCMRNYDVLHWLVERQLHV